MKILIAHAKEFRNGKTNLKNLFQTPLLIFPLPPKNIKKLDFSRDFSAGLEREYWTETGFGKLYLDIKTPENTNFIRKK